MENQVDELSWCFEIDGDLSRRTAEALRLELYRLAERYGLRIATLRLETKNE
jgi:hypothetical protein